MDFIETFFKIMFGIMIGLWLGYKRFKARNNDQN